MAQSKVLNFPKKASKKAKVNPEKLSQDLLQELTKDEGYRKFADSSQVTKGIGEAISRVRKRKKMSAAELAKRIGKTEKVVNRMERGEHKQYTMKQLLEIAGALNAKLKITLEE
jgi:ribosome-binding protein aMBF1 (putative translation factor)